MYLFIKRLFEAFLIVMALTFVGCATIPNEVVQLSKTIGQDLNAIHLSYRALIQTHFDGLRKQATDFLDSNWKPLYIKNFIKTGGLVEAVQNPDPDSVLLFVEVWSEVAIEEIEAKKHTLTDPINADEKALLSSVDAAFAELIRANAAITAHLNSIREVKKVQGQALKALRLENLLDKINNGLVAASNKTVELIEEVKKAEGIVDKASEMKEKLEKAK